MKNQQWQLGPETVIVSRNKKGEGGGERERLQGKAQPGNETAGKPSRKNKLEKQIKAMKHRTTG